MDVLLTDSDWESSSESSGSEQEEIEFSYSGQAQNIFSSLEESIGKLNDFLSFERGFTHGEIVCSITDPLGQTGRVVNINLFADLENVYGKVINEVNSKKLQKLRSISLGDYVVNGAWLGRVDKIVDCVSVVLDDGSKCEVIVSDQEKLVPLSPNLLEDSQYSYYPGQRVQARLSHVPKSTRWFCGNWRENQDVGTVCAVEAGLVYVDWVASVIMGSDLSLPAPQGLQDPKNLTLLSCFSHASWQLGDWCIFSPSSCNGVVEQNIPHACAHDLFKDYKNLKGFQRNNPSSSLDELFVIVKTKMKVDVIWQDGSCSSAVDSQMLLPIGAVNAHEFWPEQFVVEKEISNSNSKRWGVVRAVDSKELTVKVQWKSRTEKEAIDSAYDQTEETVSAYELLEHPDFGFCFSDVVCRVVRDEFMLDNSGRDHANADTSLATEAVAAFTDKKCVQRENDYLSCVGVVTGFKGGAVEVKWANGLTTEVAPYEIYRIEKSEGSATGTMSFEENVQELNQKIIESDELSSVRQQKDMMKCNGAGENCSKYKSESSSFFLPKAAIGFLTTIATSLFGSQGSTSLSGPLSCCHDSEDRSGSEVVVEEEVTGTFNLSEPNPGELDMTGKMYLKKEEGKDTEETLDSTLSEPGKNPVRFRQFDMVADCSEHYFLASSKGLAQSQVKRSWVKKVQQEWSILEADFPGSIYVRVYEERMDLLRAALVGAPGTPYHNGLFFFDILLPPQYPHEPPLVHYNSGGLRVNPNLYESGKVCLSLLNTWTGTGSEVWNPGSSTILQVLLSLQALVLNEKPYFNEAGYDKQVGRAEGEKNSASYNENAFIVTCKSMLYLLHKPPKHFEALVEEHFTRNGQDIMLACKSYMEGAPVGALENMHETSNTSSTGFKIMLGKLYPKLVEAFSEIGIDCR